MTHPELALNEIERVVPQVPRLSARVDGTDYVGDIWHYLVFKGGLPPDVVKSIRWEVHAADVVESFSLRSYPLDLCGALSLFNRGRKHGFDNKVSTGFASYMTGIKKLGDLPRLAIWRTTRGRVPHEGMSRQLQAVWNEQTRWLQLGAKEPFGPGEGGVPEDFLDMVLFYIERTKGNS